MALALLADIHANLEALRTCLAHARERGADRFAFLGDLVGYGADPGAVIDIVAEHAARGAVVVKGNHDAAIAAEDSYLNESAVAAIRWSRDVLTRGQRAFLDSLPLCVRDERVCFVHASAAVPDRWDYVDSTGAAERSSRAAERPYTFSGHVHHQVLYGEDAKRRMIAFRPQPGVPVPARAHRSWLALVGSVGQPRDGHPSAAYALCDLDRARITFHRVPYDNLAAAAKVRAAGLPDVLAYRLEKGV
jgi:diadenosine tetraphosphatase ApaH/serine/threonine PP2A family protein phosphatase